jgi:hypothetical protein
LRVVSRNVDSDLALLQQDDSRQDLSGYSTPEQILVDALRHFAIDDNSRQSVWDAYHTSSNEKTLIDALDKLNLTDEMKRTIYDIWQKRGDRITKREPTGMTGLAVFRTGPAPKLGDAVVAFGFPLPGLLSSEGNVSTGIVSAMSGLGNDVRFIQISAPVQPGNSGGPLFDSSGHVIGVVVAKLDAVRVAELTGDIPQNVNFAVRWSEVRAFLDEAGVPYQQETSQHASTTGSIAEVASRIAVPIECTSDGTESSQSQESRSQDGQAAGPSLQDTISWMQDFSSAHGEKFFDGKPSVKNVVLPDPLHQRPSANGCAVWAAHDYYGVKPGAVSAQVEFFNLLIGA